MTDPHSPSSPTIREELQRPALDASELPLQTLYRREREWAERPYLHQPMPAGARTWTWQAAVEESRRMAAFLKAQNFPPGSHILLLSKNCAWWIMADFAIWMAGHVSVPVYAAIRESTLAAILDHCQPVACVLGPTDQTFECVTARARSASMPVIELPNLPEAERVSGALLWDAIVREQAPLPGEPVRGWQEVATIIYTSGTTGQPKGVMQTFQSVALMAKSVLPAVPPETAEGARIVSYLPLAHIAERAIVEATSLYLRMQIFFVESQQTFLRDLQTAQPTIFFTIPRLLTRFQQGVHEKLSPALLRTLLRIPVLRGIVGRHILAQLGLDTVQLAASGAAPLSTDLLRWYRALGLNLIEGYGMTETGITHATLPGHLRIGYVGESSPYCETRIAADGEIQIRGAMNFLGYYRDESNTQHSFTADGFFRTGDRGVIDEVGRLRIIGRLKEEFKTAKGKYVYPAQIESLLSASGLYEAVCVLGSGMAGPFALAVLPPEKLAASRTPEQRSKIEQDLIRDMERVNAQLSAHEHLRFLAITAHPWTTANGFLTPTLKVRRAVIELHYGASFAAWEQRHQQILWLEDADA